MSNLPHVTILGAGPAGVGAAYRLRARDQASVTLIEQQDTPGGNSGSFQLNGLRVDFGSHRLHPACDPEILAHIQEFLGDDLLDRPRHGRIRLRGRWIHFPLKPVDLMLRLDPGFALGSLRDMGLKPLRQRRGMDDSFAGVLLANLGPTICDNFYFPYARKIWGRSPEQLSGIQARRRVSAGSFLKLLRKVMAAVPGLKPPGAGRFYYPRGGFGQISEAYAERARAAGADLLMGWRVSRLAMPATSEAPWRVTVERQGEARVIESDHLWSTLPISLVARMLAPAAPAAVLDAAGGIEYRAMLLVYLELDVDQFTEFDAHYFPDAEITITRLSEPKNYAALTEPRGKTILCAELPCAPDDAHWALDDEALGRLVAGDLARAGLPLRRPPVAIHVRRLRHAYPIYTTGYERAFGTLDTWAAGLPRFVSYGRQGLFAHDNTHHALFMAYSAAECLRGREFDLARWGEYRKVFDTHVVED